MKTFLESFGETLKYTLTKITLISLLLFSGGAFSVPIYNITIADDLTDGMWMTEGSVVTGNFDISGLGKINILSGNVNFSFYGDFDGYALSHIDKGAWNFVKRKGSSGRWRGDDYWERNLINHHADETEVASATILGSTQGTTASPSSSTGNIYQKTTGYIHKWDWEGRFRGWDDFGRDIIFNEYTQNAGVFYMSLPLTLYTATYLELTGGIPFNVASETGDFLFLSSNLVVNYNRVPEPSTFLMIGLGFVGLGLFSRTERMRRK